MTTLEKVMEEEIKSTKLSKRKIRKQEKEVNKLNPLNPEDEINCDCGVGHVKGIYSAHAPNCIRYKKMILYLDLKVR